MAVVELLFKKSQLTILRVLEPSSTKDEVMWQDTLLRQKLGSREQGGILGSCGHGARVYANVKLSNGKYLVSGKRVAGFPDSTEKEKSWARQGTLLPFLVESKLRQSGAKVVNKSNIADKHDVVIDRRMVSSMFLPSTIYTKTVHKYAVLFYGF